jgi:hypothetical protein
MPAKQIGENMNHKDKSKLAPEIAAIGEVHAALADLEPEAQTRVLNYVAQMLGVPSVVQVEKLRDHPEKSDKKEEQIEPSKIAEPPQDAEGDSHEIEGISPVAKKWMVRNGLVENQLTAIFSLGVDEIDLIAKMVPGTSLKDKMRAVALLKGVAAYLGTGATRFNHEQLKEACLHYKAYDATNFSKYMKSIASEVSGNASSGYMLTTRGVAAATDIIKQMVQPGKGS